MNRTDYTLKLWLEDGRTECYYYEFEWQADVFAQIYMHDSIVKSAQVLHNGICISVY